LASTSCKPLVKRKEETILAAPATFFISALLQVTPGEPSENLGVEILILLVEVLKGNLGPGRLAMTAG
jgi:hypothetical protein